MHTGLWLVRTWFKNFKSYLYGLSKKRSPLIRKYISISPCVRGIKDASYNPLFSPLHLISFTACTVVSPSPLILTITSAPDKGLSFLSLSVTSSVVSVSLLITGGMYTLHLLGAVTFAYKYRYCYKPINIHTCIHT